MNIETGDPKAAVDGPEFDDNEIDEDAGDSVETVVLDEDMDLDEDVDFEKTAVLDDPGALAETGVLDATAAATDNVGDVSVEINVEELIADIEASDDKDAARKREIRRRLEDVVEEQSFESTYAIDLDEKSD
jgi:hypothetical protein